MSSIGKNRLAIYDLFYLHPLCEYINNDALNVLIIGSGWSTTRRSRQRFGSGKIQVSN